MLTTRFAAVLVAFAAPLVPVAGWAEAFPPVPSQPGNPSSNGCPSGWEWLRVADLAPLGYRLPAQLDARGNSDGAVCGKPLSAAEQAARLPDEAVQIFDFRDNTLVHNS